MDVLLIDPSPTSPYGNMRVFGSIGTMKIDIKYPPRDLLGIIGYLRKLKISCKVIDANNLRWSLDRVVEEVRKENPHLVVFIICTTTINEDMKLARAVKEVDKNIITAAFGAHIKALPRETLEDNPCLDVAIYGDQEFIVKKIVDWEYDLSQVRGIYYRRSGEIKKNPPHGPMLLDNYGIPAHDTMNQKLYHDPLAKWLPMTITYGQVGCINNCVYCMSRLYGRPRWRSPLHFAKELKFIEALGFKEVFFIDCGFTNDMRWADAVVGLMITMNMNLSWWCLARADRLSWRMLWRMAMAGCHAIGVGVESANSQILKNIQKNIDPNQVLEVVKMIHNFGMKVLLYFQFGLPGETKGTMRTTLEFAKRSGADFATFGISVPVPGTPFYDYIKKNGYFITDDWSKFDPTKPPVYDYPGLSSKEIFKFSKKAYREFYLPRWKKFNIKHWKSALQFMRRYL